MVGVQNYRVADILREEAGLTLSEVGNVQVSTNAIPVIDVTPSNHPPIQSFRAQSSSSGTMTVYTPGVNGKKLYITGVYVSLIKDVTCDIASSFNELVGTKNGQTARIMGVSVLTLTAQTFNQYISFIKPYVLDTNSTITFSGTFTAGSMVRGVIVYGYEI
jgi:hypothetical protein